MLRLALRAGTLRPLVLVAIGAVTLAGTGCGYTKEEYQLQGDKLTRAVAKQRTAETRADETAAELELTKERIVELEEKMRALGIDLQVRDGRIGDMAATLAERERALAEFKNRAAKLEETRARLQLLRAKLDELATVGVEVRVRKNRMVIVLPSDVLFDSGKDKLKNKGKDALRSIAAILKNDPVLSARDFQVAGHTDDKAVKGGAYADNMALSLMRARNVLSFLIDPREGGLQKERFSASGYGDTDPIVPNDSDESRQRNRRSELVIVPALNEMLDLRTLAGEAPPRPPPKDPVIKEPAKDPAPRKEPAKKEPGNEPAKEPPLLPKP